MKQPILNVAKKEYAKDMHTCEHILNQTMIRIFDCGRSFDAHIERKKSKCDYHMQESPTEAQIVELTNKVNEIIGQHLPVTIEHMSREEAGKVVDLSKLPAEASETLRIVRVGDYDTCACIGQHVRNTSELGRFEVRSHEFDNGRWRVRFKLYYI
jgi:misacylated tRNA(Ala) deacylase